MFALMMTVGVIILMNLLLTIYFAINFVYMFIFNMSL